MKTSIKLTALLLLAGTGLFAATPSTVKGGDVPAKKDLVTFSALKSDIGVAVNVQKSDAGKTVVLILDKDQNVIYKDALPQGTNTEKGYNFSQLENGDYTIEVISNKQVVKKDVHIYDEDEKKMFFVKQ